MNVAICKDPLAWDAYVTTMLEASNYHRWGWRGVIEETFGHESYYLAAYSNGSIQGVLPLVRMKSHLFGHFLVSMPFFSYGGILASSSEAREALLVHSGNLASELGASHIELRQGDAQPCAWQDTTAKVTMEIELPESVETLWTGLRNKQRNEVRNARKNNFRVEWSGIEGVDAFYGVFAANMRNLGTPVYPRSWFANLCRRFPGEVHIVTLWDKEEPVASGLVTAYREGVELPWAASTPQSRRKYSAVLLYWTLMEWAVTNKFRRVDFGRCTKDSGVYDFKKHWGSKERSLHWYYWLAPGAPVPELRPGNPRYHLATEVWKRLPLPVANFLGPHIVRSIP